MEPPRTQQVWKLAAAGHDHQPFRRRFRGGPASCCRGTSPRTSCTESQHARARHHRGVGNETNNNFYSERIAVRIHVDGEPQSAGWRRAWHCESQRENRSICTPTRAAPRGEKSERRTAAEDRARAAAENGRRRTGICPSSSRAPARRAATRRCHRTRTGTSAPPMAPRPPPPWPAPPARGASSIPPPSPRPCGSRPLSLPPPSPSFFAFVSLSPKEKNSSLLSLPGPGGVRERASERAHETSGASGSGTHAAAHAANLSRGEPGW